MQTWRRLQSAVGRRPPCARAMATSGGPVSEVEFVTPPSQSLLCPVCHDVCHEPLITNVCHHSFCTACIFQTLEQGESACPLCRRHLSDRGAPGVC